MSHLGAVLDFCCAGQGRDLSLNDDVAKSSLGTFKVTLSPLSSKALHFKSLCGRAAPDEISPLSHFPGIGPFFSYSGAKSLLFPLFLKVMKMPQSSGQKTLFFQAHCKHHRLYIELGEVHS